MTGGASGGHPELLAVGDVGVDSFAAVDHLPRRDEKLWVLSSEDLPGGMMGNVASVAARLGCPSGVVARAGDDRHGDLVAEALADAGVDLRYLRRIADRTFNALAVTEPDGGRALLQYDTEAFHADWSAVSPDGLAATRWVHTSLDQERCLSAVASDARAAGVSMSVDCEYPYILRDDVVDLLDGLRVVFVNEQAAEALGGVDAAIAWALDKGCRTAVVTIGEKGCVVGNLAGEAIGVHVPAHPVEPIDTNGAGDAFAAAFAVAALADWDDVAAAQFAAMVAALSTTGRGGQGADLSRARLVDEADAAGYPWRDDVP
ncbi:MAG TPA: carbohydrate kinase family protein [Nocardioidaceae bacterium]|nr:carbohydrate kinase family protein [Nocardioidaceae bacterium]